MDSDRNTYHHSDAYDYAYSHGDTHGDADSDPNAHPDVYALRVGYRSSVGVDQAPLRIRNHAVAVDVADNDAYSNGDSYGHADDDTNGHTDSDDHATTDADAAADTDTDSRPDEHAEIHASPDTDTDKDPETDCDAMKRTTVRMKIQMRGLYAAVIATTAAAGALMFSGIALSAEQVSGSGEYIPLSLFMWVVSPLATATAACAVSCWWLMKQLMAVMRESRKNEVDAAREVADTVREVMPLTEKLTELLPSMQDLVKALMQIVTMWHQRGNESGGPR